MSDQNVNANDIEGTDRKSEVLLIVARVWHGEPERELVGRLRVFEAAGQPMIDRPFVGVDDLHGQLGTILRDFEQDRLIDLTQADAGDDADRSDLGHVTLNAPRSTSGAPGAGDVAPERPS